MDLLRLSAIYNKVFCIKMKTVARESKNVFQALCWSDVGKLELVKKPRLDLAKGEIRVKVEICSICGSDLRTLSFGNSRVKSGRVIGHEISGKVIEIGVGVEHFCVGDSVSIGADIPCGNCAYCQIGNEGACLEHLALGHQIDGGFAEELVLSDLFVRNGPVKKVIKNVNFEVIALAEPLACCLNGFKRVSESDLLDVLIIGCGPIGIMLASLALQKGAAKVTICDRSEQRLALGQEILDHKGVSNLHFELDSTVRARLTGPAKVDQQLGPSLIFTACASHEAQTDALRFVRKGGVVNFFGGVPQGVSTMQLDTNEIHYKELVITGSTGSSPKQHSEALNLLITDLSYLSKLVTHRFSLSEAMQAFAVAGSEHVMKIAIQP